MKKTNFIDRHGNKRYRLQRKVGMKLNSNNEWVNDVRSFYGSCKREAEEKYVAFVARKEENKMNSQYTCLGQAIDVWTETVFKKSDLANSTKKKYLSAYERLLKNSYLAGQRISEVSALDVQKLYNSITECYSSRRALHNFLSRFYKYAEVNSFATDITRSLVVQRDATKKEDFDIEVWSDDELKALIGSLEGNLLRLLVVLAVNTGARFSELLALTYDDIMGDMLSINKQLYEFSAVDSEDPAVLHIEPVKTEASNRLIPLADEVVSEIEKHKKLQEAHKKIFKYENNGLLFSTKNGTMLYKRNVRRSLQRHCKKEGIPFHKFHAFRHTFGTNLSRQGVPLEEISKLMGHSSTEISSKYYIYVDALRRKKAVEKIVSYSLKRVTNS